ncbi:MAG: glycerol kinase GlpK [Deltaproteobacteria bacterium]|nr:glycerol kinase GlpK [Deltaproteobacteria bacterium]
MASPHVVAIDQGTTGSTVLVLDKKLEVRGRANYEFPQHFPGPGQVEHDLGEIWKSVQQALKKALGQAGVKGSDIAAIGITNQRETTCLWHRGTGEPLHRAIVWQDRRTAERCGQLRKEGLSKKVQKTTGLVLDPYFSGTKLEWLLKNVKGAKAAARKGDLAFGTIDTFLVWKLTGGAAHVTDVTNASRTLLMNLKRRKWDPGMLELLGVPEAVLPEIRPSAQIYGTTSGLKVLPDGIPVAGMAGDQQAALFGQACFGEGEAKCTYGTGAFLLMNVGEKAVYSKNGLLSTVAWEVDGKAAYALEGSVFIAGAAVQWLRDGLKFFKSAPEIEALARSVPDANGVVFVPALAGLGAPHWRPEARGLLCGLERSTTRAHLARAALEGIALSVHDLAAAMQKDAGGKMPRFKVDGGACQNDLLMQFQADLLNVPVVRPEMIETTALGAAFLAGLSTGVWGSTAAIKRAWKSDRTFKPAMRASVREAHLARWRSAVERA